MTFHDIDGKPSHARSGIVLWKVAASAAQKWLQHPTKNSNNQVLDASKQKWVIGFRK